MSLRTRDYSGVPSKQLAQLVRMSGVKVGVLAQRIGMDESDLRKHVINTKPNQWTSLMIADRILLGIGLNITHLELSGEIDVIPAVGNTAARKMAVDYYWARDEIPTREEVTKLAKELEKKRKRLLR